MPELSRRSLRFGAFEVDLERAELRKHGVRLRLQEQPFQVLAALLERPGQVISREELIQRLWPDGTVVDFDRGLNAGVTRLRQALSDSADTPRFVETVARRGYRFIGPLEEAGERPEPGVAEKLASNTGSSSVRTAHPLRLMAVSMVIVALGIAVALWLWNRKQQPERNVSVKTAMLTGAAGLERHPSFSPDGTQVVYEWDRQNGDHHIYLKSTGPGDPSPLTSGASVDYSPAWSPDGKWIAFLRKEKLSSFGVYLIAPVGGTPRKVADIESLPVGVLNRHYRRIDWTRDSTHVIVAAFGRPPGWESLLLLSIDTGEKTWLTEAPADMTSGDREPAVSPDGAMVAFVRGPLDGETLFVLPLTAGLRPAGPPRQIGRLGRARSPVWMQDGRKLIFVAFDNGVLDGVLSRLDLDAGGPPQPLLGFGRNLATPVVSRQGQIAYSITTGDGIIWRQDIARTGQSAQPPVQVRASATFQIGAQYSPDGTRIAFGAERSGSREIWNCGSDGTHCLQVTSLQAGSSTAYPRWSPDGKRLLFESMAGGESGTYVVNAEGGQPSRVDTGEPHGGTPYWSHDGKWIYYSFRDNKGTRQIWRIPASGGNATLIVRNGGYIPVDSPDSRTLYYIKPGSRGSEAIFRSAPDGAGEQELVPRVSFSGFAITKDRIYYLLKASERITEIRQFLLATREDLRVAEIDKPLTWGLSISPDGRSLLFSEWRLRGTLMIAEKPY